MVSARCCVAINLVLLHFDIFRKILQEPFERQCVDLLNLLKIDKFVQCPNVQSQAIYKLHQPH